MIPCSLDNSSYDNLIVGIWNRQLSVYGTGNCRYSALATNTLVRVSVNTLTRVYVDTLTRVLVAGTIYLQSQVPNTDDGRCRILT